MEQINKDRIMNELTNGKTIRIQIGKVNQPVVETIKSEFTMEKSLFGTQYRQMLTMLNRYCKHRIEYIATKRESPNNIFAFVGDRGSGKTSCMSSVSQLLVSNGLKSFTSFDHLSKTTFETIDIIDPSYFDEHHNIVATMVAKLYKSFKQKEDLLDQHKYNFDVHRELTSAFAKTQKSMRCLLENDSNTDYEYDDIERLSDLSMAVDLKDDVDELVNQYLRFVNKEGGVLVLSIDDIDLNISEADTMAEQIRKYLVSPHIVILLAAKLDQLATIKNLHYAEKYKYLIDGTHLSYSTVEEMTGQFLTKFAPHDQRIYMPTADFYLESGIQINDDNLNGVSVRQAIPEMIFNRTRYLFYNSKQTASYIVPRNLRKVCQLAALLWPMNPYDINAAETNKETFRTYLFGTWMQDNLTQKDRVLANRLIDGWKNDLLNGAALEILREKYSSWLTDAQTMDNENISKSDLPIELKHLLDRKNREFNISIGDVMSLICNLQITQESHEDRCFFFIINTIYSFALYEKYDLITAEQDADGYQLDKDYNSKDNGQVLLYDPFEAEHVYDYHKLVGGRFFNYRLYPTLPKEGNVSRSDRMISYMALSNLLDECIQDWKKYNLANVVSQEIDRTELIKKIRLSEFFMLCCSRDINMQNNKKKDPDYYDPAFRQSDIVGYNGDFTGERWLYFDLGAFFYNVTNIRSCYRRFKESGKEFFDLCFAETGYTEEGKTKYLSLFSTFLNKSIEYREDYDKPHAWQSWSSIRNAEILFDLNQHLRAKCMKGKGSNRQFLQQYFKALSEYQIRTYDRDAIQKHLTISFSFAEEISSLLSDASIETNFKDVFEAIVKDKRDVTTGSTVMNMDLKLLVDVDALVKGRSDDRNRKISVLKALREKQTDAYSGNELLVKAIFDSYEDYMTKEQIRDAATKLNVLIINKYGSSQGNTENIISSAEPEVDSPETEG